MGLLGAAIGLLLGAYLAAALGVRLLDATYAELVPRWEILVAALAGAPLLSAVASYLPTLAAVMQDPAVVLRDQ
jgi:ABC-type lipoprotein release transport system permease subunit